MKYYAAFLEGLTPLQEEQLTCILFNQLCSYLKQNKKKSKPIIIDEMNEKIWQQEKLFFHYNKNTRLLETECVKYCQAALVIISKKIGLDKLCSDFFKNLKFAPSEAEALMLSDNGLLFLQSVRVHESKNSKNLPLFEDFNKKKSDHRLIISERKKGASKLYQDKTFLNKFGKLLLAARDQQIKLQACDVNSLNFVNQSEPILDAEHRLKVGNACMIRSIETLQFKQKYPKFLLLVGLAHAPHAFKCSRNITSRSRNRFETALCLINHRINIFNYL